MSEKEEQKKIPEEKNPDDSLSTSNMLEKNFENEVLESDNVSDEMISLSMAEKISSEKNSLESENKSKELTVNELNELLLKEKHKVAEYEGKLKHTLADFQNLEKKIKSDIEKGVNTKMDQFMLDFLQIYDDFIRAKIVFVENNINVEGLDSILKNMDSLLSKYHITSIDALGEIFDPKLHEAISVIEDPTLDDDVITKVIRKGYISHNRVIRPALVEITKKTKSEQLGE